MTDQEYHEKIMEYAHSLGYPYAKPMTTPGFERYFVLYTEQMKQCPGGKFGSPKIVSLSEQGEPYLLNRSQFTELHSQIRKVRSDF